MHYYFLCCRKIFKYCLGIDHYLEKYASKLYLFGYSNDKENRISIISFQLLTLIHSGLNEKFSLGCTKIWGGFFGYCIKLKHTAIVNHISAFIIKNNRIFKRLIKHSSSSLFCLWQTSLTDQCTPYTFKEHSQQPL